MQYLGLQHQVDLIVVHNENGHAAPCLLLLRTALPFSGFTAPVDKFHVKEEAAAPSLLAFQQQRILAVAHLLHHLAADGQPQSRAPVFSGNAAVPLGEGLEDALLPVPGDANAGVLHGELQDTLPLPLHEAPDAQGHGSFLREFEGIVEEVREYLLQPQGISVKIFRQRLRKVHDELKPPLFCFIFQHGLQVCQYRMKVKILVLKDHAARLELRIIQDLVDLLEENVCCQLHILRIAPLGTGQPGILQKIEIAGDGI